MTKHKIIYFSLSTVLSARTHPWCLPALHLSVNTEKPTEENPATACSTSVFPLSRHDSTSSKKAPSAPHLPVLLAPRRSVTAFLRYKEKSPTCVFLHIVTKAKLQWANWNKFHSSVITFDPLEVVPSLGVCLYFLLLLRCVGGAFGCRVGVRVRARANNPG